MGGHAVEFVSPPSTCEALFEVDDKLEVIHRYCHVLNINDDNLGQA